MVRPISDRALRTIKGIVTGEISVNDTFLRNAMNEAQASGKLVKISSNKYEVIGRIASIAHEVGGPSHYSLEITKYVVLPTARKSRRRVKKRRAR